jgi:uncharacterized protein (TIGR02145 family)
MKKLYIALALLVSGTALGQIEQNVNKPTGTVSNAINDIDSIRFNAGQTEMQIILNSGTVVNHAILDVNNVTFSGTVIGEIGVLNCAAASINGTLVEGVSASGVSVNIAYTAGNGGAYSAQSVSSTGVDGLTAILAAGAFTNGSGNLSYTITGTPSAAGTASFAISIGGQSCSFMLSVSASSGQTWPAGTVHCTEVPTAIVDVTNPITGAIWMDRNLGASQVATSSTDDLAYGDLYQWGRRADGHQCRNSPTTATLSSVDQPEHGDFIIAPNNPKDWRSPQNDNLWQGVNGVNNPCPSGYRIPTEAELDAECLIWSPNNAAGAYASPLKLPMAGSRNPSGSIFQVGTQGTYWSSTVSGLNAIFLISSFAFTPDNFRALGYSVRCIKD